MVLTGNREVCVSQTLLFVSMMCLQQLHQQIIGVFKMLTLAPFNTCLVSIVPALFLSTSLFIHVLFILPLPWQSLMHSSCVYPNKQLQQQSQTPTPPPPSWWPRHRPCVMTDPSTALIQPRQDTHIRSYNSVICVCAFCDNCDK